ncbi:Alpha/Beta hydrolase protein, partial [Ilyonectria destructans]
MHHLILISTAVLGCLPLVLSSSAGDAALPTVNIHNGTLVGTRIYSSYQESFLGIPYAQPPVGQLRFARPEPLESRWPSPRNATDYGPFCLGNAFRLVGFSQESNSYHQSEDCLTINVVRPITAPASKHQPSSSAKGPLPVLVWLYGGGFQEGGSGDARYDMSNLVKKSFEIGRPIIGVSFNYRVGIFGFASGRPFREAGTANLGIHDQRLALRWIQENIKAFGGDPTRVTIAGESAGAGSVGLHLIANNGRNDRLFNGAIAQSGGPLYYIPQMSEVVQDAQLDALIKEVDCLNSTDSISCLRQIPAEALKQASMGVLWNPVTDQDLFLDLPSVALAKGAFVPVPLLIGSNTNEGTPFMPLFSNISASEPRDFSATLRSYFGPTKELNETIQRLDEFYSAAMEDDIESALGTVLANPKHPYGPLYGKISTLLGDLLFTAGRRITAEAWAAKGLPAYSYRFDTVPAGVDPETLGAAHFQEIAFVFGNTEGKGYDINPFSITDPRIRAKYLDMSELMSRMWISFTNSGTPNNHRVRHFKVQWPEYEKQNPRNIVFNATAGAKLEADDYRREAIDYIRNTAASFNRKL